jgi:hypothetical protein
VVAHWHSTGITVDGQPEDTSGHCTRARKATRLAQQPLDPGPQSYLLALALLRLSLARTVRCSIERPRVGTPMIGMIVSEAKGLYQCLQQE